MNRSGLAGAFKLRAEATRVSSACELNPTFNAFLFATVCEERNEMPLSVISVLARLDLDPWTEAAELSRLPADSATRRLSSLLDAVVSDPPIPLDPRTTAARLVALLPTPPNTAVSRNPAGNLAALQRKIAGAVWLVFLASMAVSLIVGNLAPRPSGFGPIASTAARP